MSFYGPELVVNGGFDNALVGWSYTESAGWSVQGGWALYQKTAQDPDNLDQSIEIISGKTYQLRFEIANFFFDGTVKVILGGTEVNVTEEIEFSENIICGSTDTLIRIYVSGGTIGDFIIDDVSVREILPDIVSEAEEIEAALYDLLRLDLIVSGLVSNRIYPQIVPQKAALPAITYQQISGPRNHTMDGTCEIIPSRYQINVWAKTYAELRALSNAVLNCLDSYRGTVGSITIDGIFNAGEMDLYEGQAEMDQLRRFGKALDFMIYYRA